LASTAASTAPSTAVHTPNPSYCSSTERLSISTPNTATNNNNNSNGPESPSTVTTDSVPPPLDLSPRLSSSSVGTSLTVMSSPASTVGTAGGEPSPVSSSAAPTPSSHSCSSSLSPPSAPTPSSSSSSPLAPHATTLTVPASILPKDGSTEIPVLEIHLIVHVNKEFERLFGFSQSEMKVMCMREGRKSLYRLTRADSLEALHKLDMRAVFSGQTEFKSYITCVNKWQCEFGAMLHRRFVVDPVTGQFGASMYTWIPLPTSTSTAKPTS